MSSGIRFDSVTDKLQYSTPGVAGDGTAVLIKAMHDFDIKAVDANAITLTKLMDGVDIFSPGWNDIDTDHTSYVEDRKSATGS